MGEGTQVLKLEGSSLCLISAMCLWCDFFVVVVVGGGAVLFICLHHICKCDVCLEEKY